MLIISLFYIPLHNSFLPAIKKLRHRKKRLKDSRRQKFPEFQSKGFIVWVSYLETEERRLYDKPHLVTLLKEGLIFQSCLSRSIVVRTN